MTNTPEVIEMLPCFQCGSQPLEIDYGGVLEYYGFTEQAGHIKCSGTNLAHCPVEVYVSYDSVGGMGDRIENALKVAWNALNQGYKVGGE